MGMLIPDSTGQQGALHHREGLQFFHPHFVIELGPLAEPATGCVHQDPVKPAGREGRCALFSCRDKLLVDRYWTGWVYSPGGTPSPATAFLPSATKAVTLSRPSLAQVCRMETTWPGVVTPHTAHIAAHLGFGAVQRHHPAARGHPLPAVRGLHNHQHRWQAVPGEARETWL